MNILEQIIATKRQEVAAAKAVKSLARIEAEVAAAKAVKSLARIEAEVAASLSSHDRPRHSFRGALEQSPTGIIAEFKRKSPSKGFINREADAAQVVAGYDTAGASAVSVLTDRDYFGGGFADLRAARGAAGIPLLRKDFIVDPYQLCEARLLGADVILLIAAALTPGEVQSLARYAHSLSLEVLLEIHNEAELEHLCDETDVVGINNRDLATFRTDTARSFSLGERIPDQFVKISESGISDPQTVRKLRDAGFRGFLMGENFMKTSDPAAALREFIAALQRTTA